SNRSWLTLLVGMFFLVSISGAHQTRAAPTAAAQYQVDLPIGVPVNLVQPILGRESVVDPFDFSGLAGYLNDVNFYLVEHNQRTRLVPGSVVRLTDTQTFAAVGRFNTLVVQAGQTTISLARGKYLVITPDSSTTEPIKSWLLPK